MIRRILSTVVVATFALSVGCGGDKKPARSAHDADYDSETSETASTDDVEQSDDGGGPRKNDEHNGPREETKDSNNPKNNPDVEFKEGGTVEEAINAVPQGLPRENIDQEDLNRPLLEPALYSECKLGPSQHFEMRYAVWDGRIVGIDLKTMPKSAKVEECVRNAVQKVKWREKSKSLNISTVSF